MRVTAMTATMKKDELKTLARKIIFYAASVEQDDEVDVPEVVDSREEMDNFVDEVVEHICNKYSQDRGEVCSKASRIIDSLLFPGRQ